MNLQSLSMANEKQDEQAKQSAPGAEATPPNSAPETEPKPAPAAAKPAPEAKPGSEAKPAAPKPAGETKPATESKAAPKPAPAKPAGPVAEPWQSDIVDSLQTAFPELPFEPLSYLSQHYLIVPHESILPVCTYLKSECGFDMLTDLTAIDYPKREQRFEVIYQFYSFSRNERLRLKVPLGEEQMIESVVPIWGTADWLEREVYDMFGIRFANHPHLTRILLPDEWEGYPLRKDYGIQQQDVKWVQENLHIESGQ